ncbi:hypothetical protein OROMI_004431 [Orobanche minor]
MFAGIFLLKLASLAASYIAGREVKLQYFLVDSHGLITDRREVTDAYAAHFISPRTLQMPTD